MSRSGSRNVSIPHVPATPSVVFNKQLIHKIYESVWQFEGTDIKKDALSLSSELLRIFTREVLVRAADCAASEESDTVEPEHLEKIIVQLIMDFHLSTRAAMEKLVRYVITLEGDEPVEMQMQKAHSKDNDTTTPTQSHPEDNNSITSTNNSNNHHLDENTNAEQQDNSAINSSSTSSATTSAAIDTDPSPQSNTDSDESTQPTKAESHSDSDQNNTDNSTTTSEQQQHAETEMKEETDAVSTTTTDRPNKHKYPYVASELFACEVVSMLDVLFDHPELLDLLFSFLDHPAPMDPANASYFRKVMVVLIQRKYEALVKYIQSHHIIDKLVSHIGLYSIMEILIMIGWDDGLGQVNDVEWLYKENLIPKLVAKLTPEYESQTDVHMNAARALVDVVVKCPPSQQNLLISHLQSTPVLTTIFQHMFSGSLSSLTNSMSIIIVLVQRYANKRVENGEEKPPDEQHPAITITPPSTNSSSDESNHTESNTDTHTATYDDKPTSNSTTSTNSSSDPPLEEPFGSLAPHLHKIIDLLHQPQSEVKVQFGRSQPFGETRMKVVELTLVLLRSRLLAVDQQLARLHVLSNMLECFFAYPWNNMLHGLVESIVRTVLDSDSGILKKSLFEDGDLVERFIAAYERSEAETRKPNGYRLGYIGHLIRTSVAIEDLARKSDEIRQELFGAKSARWSQFVSETLERENEKQQAIAPFVGADEDILDGLQFDIAGMSNEVNSYLTGNNPIGLGGDRTGLSGSGGVHEDQYAFDDEPEDDAHTSGMGYDYTSSYSIRDPDTEYEQDNNNTTHINDASITSNNNNNNNDDWGDFSTQFAATTISTIAPEDEFSRGAAGNTSGRQLMQFNSTWDDDEEETMGNGEQQHEQRQQQEDVFNKNPVTGDGTDPLAAASSTTATPTASWPPADFAADFDADFDADFATNTPPTETQQNASTTIDTATTITSSQQEQKPSDTRNVHQADYDFEAETDFDKQRAETTAQHS